MPVVLQRGVAFAQPGAQASVEAETVAVIDFETTGMGPAQGARATEIAAVLVRGGRIVGHYQSLMHTGVWVPPFIEQLTGITNAMLNDAPPAQEVMREVHAFTRGCGMVAHNASFDRGFWLHELAQAGCTLHEQDQAFACTMLLSRRLHPEAPNHRVGSLVAFHGVVPTGRAHRALADAEMAAEVWLHQVRQVERRLSAQVPHGLMCALQRSPKAQLAQCVARYFERGEPRVPVV